MNVLKLKIIVDTRATVILEKQPNGKVHSATFTPGGIELEEAVIAYLRENHEFLTNRLVAELAILSVGSALPSQEKSVIKISGRNLETGLPHKLEVSTQDIHQAISTVIDQIVHKVTFEIHHNIVPNHGDSTVDENILLSGDFRHLHGLDQLLEDQIRLKAIPKAKIMINQTNEYNDW